MNNSQYVSKEERYIALFCGSDYIAGRTPVFVRKKEVPVDIFPPNSKFFGNFQRCVSVSALNLFLPFIL